MGWYLVIDREDVVMVIQNEPKLSEVIADKESQKEYAVYEKSKENKVAFVTEYFREGGGNGKLQGRKARRHHR